MFAALVVVLGGWSDRHPVQAAEIHKAYVESLHSPPPPPPLDTWSLDTVRAWVSQTRGIDAAKFADSKIDGPALHELWLQRNEPAGQAAWNQLLGDAELAVKLQFAHRLRGVSRVALAPAPPPPPPPYPSPPPSPFAPVPAGPKTGGIIGALLG